MAEIKPLADSSFECVLLLSKVHCVKKWFHNKIMSKLHYIQVLKEKENHRKQNIS